MQREVFNDLSNLEPQCATCNTSHDWKTYYFQDEDDTKFEKKFGDDSRSEFEDEDDNLVDEDFIASDVCPQYGDEYTELFNNPAYSAIRAISLYECQQRMILWTHSRM